jgi:cytochrome c-type biogenesis protein CcmF
VGLALWVIVGSINGVIKRCRARQQAWHALFHLPRAYVGQHLAHIGFAVTLIGVTLVSLNTVDLHTRLSPGESAQVAGFEFRMLSLGPLDGPNYKGTEARFAVWRDGEEVAQLSAQKRQYPVRGMALTEAGIVPGLVRDLYVSLGEPLDGKAWSVRLSVKPFVRWLWLGALLMAAGGVLALSDSRFRRLAARREVQAATRVSR